MELGNCGREEDSAVRCGELWSPHYLVDLAIDLLTDIFLPQRAPSIFLWPLRVTT